MWYITQVSKKIMERIPLKALERTIVGKKVSHLRKAGFTPGHVYGQGKEVENVSVNSKEFAKVLRQAGETGVLNLRVGEDRAIPVLIRGVQHNPNTGQLLNIDFFKVDLTEKVQVAVPVVIIGELPESVRLGETVVLQPVSEVQIEALPDDLIDKLEVDQATLKQIDDAVTVDQLVIDREKITVLTPGEEVIIKMAPAITEEMKKLMEEQEAEAAAAAEAVAAEEAPAEGEATAEGEESAEAVEGETSEPASETVESEPVKE